MDALEFTKRIFRSIADKGFFVNASLFVDSTILRLIEKCNYLSAILGSEGKPVYQFESFVNSKQTFALGKSLIPSIFKQSPDESKQTSDEKAIVILSSPFATIKEAITSFLSNISYSKVCIYFTADCEITMQNNLNGIEFGENLNNLISPLPYITEYLSNQEDTVEAYSFAINAIPLLADPYLKTNIFQLIDPTLQTEPFNRSNDNWVTSILRFLYTFDFNVTDYVFHLGYQSKEVAQSIHRLFKTKSDNNGYALVIVDHSIDLLSVLQKSKCRDICSFLKCLSLLPTSSSHNPHQDYSILETEEELLLKEWIKREGNVEVHERGSFIDSTCYYLEDLCEKKNVTIEKQEYSLSYLDYLNHQITTSAIHEDYFETTSLVHRFICQVSQEEECCHSFFQPPSEITDCRSFLLSYMKTPCDDCDELPTLIDLFDMILLLAFDGHLRYASQDTLLTTLMACLEQCNKEQIVKVPRILSEDMVKQLQSGSKAIVEMCCKQLCYQESVLMKLIDSVSVLKQRIHSETFRTNPGHFLVNILRCADEAANASDAPNAVCNTDIYTTKEMKQPEPSQGYFSFLKSFISVERESMVKDREGIIILSLDGVYEEELIQVLIDMKKRNDRGVRDLVLVSHQFGKENHIFDLF